MMVEDGSFRPGVRFVVGGYHVIGVLRIGEGDRRGET